MFWAKFSCFFSYSNQTPFLFLQVMEANMSSEPQRPSYKQVVVQDHLRNPILTCRTPITILNFLVNPVEIRSFYSVEQDDVHELVDSNLRYMSIFYHLYLIGEILRDEITIKVIMAKCSAYWQVAGEINFVDKGNGFSLVTFTNEIDCNMVFESQL